MATYLQGVQDNVEKIRPPQPNLQFEAQLLQTRQAKYDAGHKKLSDMYGKILNSGLTREQNIKARDEFFKLIDQDLQKIAGMDLSLDSNVSKAQRVFSQVYENDYLVKDMVWTKNYQNEMKRAEAFKNCVDPEKCGGQYWDEGIKAMQYKRQEFAETDNADSLTFSNAEFVPYHNLMEKAMEHAEEAGLNITQDMVQGNYKYTYKNGQLLVSPLTDLFSKLYGENPAYQKQYEVQAYNARKDWASGQVAAGNFGSMQEAEVGYITQRSQQLNEAVTNAAAAIGADASMIDKQLANLTDKIKANKVKEGSPEHQRYIQLSQLKQLSDQASKFAEVSKTAMKKANDHRTIRAIGAQLDQGTAIALMDKEIRDMANIMSKKDASVTMEADEFAKMRVKHGYDVALENLKTSNKIKVEDWKKKHGHSSYTPKDGGLPVSVANKIDKDFKKINGSEQALKDIKAEADAKFEEYSSDDLNDAANVASDRKFTDNELDPTHKDYIRADQLSGKDKRAYMQQKNKWSSDRKQAYILKRKAEMLDKQFTDANLSESANYLNTLNTLGGDALLGTGGNTGGNIEGQGGGLNLPAGGGGGGEGDGFYKYNNANYEKRGNDWYKEVDGEFVKLSKGDVAQRSKVLNENAKPVAINAPAEGQADAKWSDVPFGDDLTDDALNSTINYIAENATDPAIKKYYTAIKDKGGAKYFRTKDDKEREKVYGLMGKRMDQIEAKQKGKNGKIWQKSDDIVLKKGEAEKEFKKLNNTARENKLSIAKDIADNYLMSLNENTDADEIKSLQKYFERYIIKYGDISSGGEVTYGGKSYGFIYYDRDGSQVRVTSSNPDGISKDDPRRKQDYVQMRWGSTEESLSLANMKKIIRQDNTKWLSNSLVNHRIRGRVDETQGSYFKSDAYKEDLANYEHNDEIHNAMVESKTKVAPKIQSAMQEYLTENYADMNLDADDFVGDNGYFTFPKGWELPQDEMEAIRTAYNDAITQQYIENGINEYMVGLGSRQQNTMKSFDVDINDTDPDGVAVDVRAYVDRIQFASDDVKNIASANTAFSGFGDATKDEILQNLLNGKYDIESVSYNPIGGVDPRVKDKLGEADDYYFWQTTSKLDVSKQATQIYRENDFSRMVIKTKGGGKMILDLSNQIHGNKLKLFKDSQNTQKANSLNALGEYTYRGSGGKDLSHLTNNEPVMIQRKSATELQIQGRMYTWDPVAETGQYVDIQRDLFDAYNLPLVGSPEELEVMLDGLFEQSQKQYETYEQNATL